jgi:hypothetical protein
MDPNRVKTVVVHIGAPKTGSSSIQMFLADHPDLLREHDITFPIMYPHEVRYFANGYAFLAPQDRRKLSDAINLAATQTVLFSEEMIFFTGQLSDLLDPIWAEHKLKIVLYVRNAPEYLASLWGELNKFENRSYPSPLADYMASDIYLSRLTGFMEFAAAHPEIDYIVRPYDTSQLHNANSIDDFLSILGIENVSRPDTAEENLSEPRAFADIMQELYSHGVVQRLPFDVSVTSAAIKRMSRKITTGDPRKITETLDDALIQKVVDAHQAAFDRLFAAYGDGRIMQPYPRCFKRERPAHQPLSLEDRQTIAAWASAVGTFIDDASV